MFKKIIPRTKNKVFAKFSKIVDAEYAISHLKDGDTLLSGGFGMCGNPNTLIKEIKRKRIGNLTVVSTNAALDHYGLGLLLHEKLVKRMVSSYIGENREFQRQYMQGELELEITPQGTLAEKIRSAKEFLVFGLQLGLIL
jgi:acyl CoA:acetate/3-ketoacid CoA transferase alpha subunit